jgi:acyl-CoA thioester hydrolase
MGVLTEDLAQFPIVIDDVVRWGDLDALGHVNNTVFFRYFESARVAYLDRVQFWPKSSQEGTGPILASTQCRFRRPLRYPDRLKLGARVVSLEEDRFTMEYAVWSESQATIAARGEAVIVAFDYGQGRKVPLPEVTRQALLALEPSAGAITRS